MKRFSAFDSKSFTALELVEDIRSGKNECGAKADLYLLLRRVILPYLHRKLPPALRPRVDAEDVLHEAFLRAMSHLDRFESSSDKAFYAWIYRIAKNLIQDQCRRRSALQVRFARDDEKGLRESQILGRTGKSDSQIVRRELVDRMLGHLKRKQADVIRLHDLEGRNFGEIAQSWDKTPGAVQRFYSRALEDLRAGAFRSDC